MNVYVRAIRSVHWIWATRVTQKEQLGLLLYPKRLSLRELIGSRTFQGLAPTESEQKYVAVISAQL